MANANIFKGALILKETQTPQGPYVYGSQTGGAMAILLPYRKKMGAVQYLLRREYIPCWDSHMDTCGIAVLGAQESLETLLVETLKKEAGYIVKPDALNPLGACATDRYADTTCYLYAVDVTKHSITEERLEISEEMTYWGSAEDILESVDSQLITCYAKAQYLLF